MGGFHHRLHMTVDGFFPCRMQIEEDSSSDHNSEVASGCRPCSVARKGHCYNYNMVGLPSFLGT